MLLRDERSCQTHCLDGRRSDPVAGGACSAVQLHILAFFADSRDDAVAAEQASHYAVHPLPPSACASSIPGGLMAPRHLRIFLSSPGDVARERHIARTLIKEKLPVAPFLRDKVTFDLVSWDDPNAPTPTPAHLTPQSAINFGLKKPSECNIVILILWSRMGTPLPVDEYKKDDGTPYFSGTEWEFTDALTAARKTGGSPTILVYRRTEVPQHPITLTDDQLQDSRLQWSRVAKFFEQFRNPDGSLVGGTHEYTDPADFGGLLNQHLLMVVRDLLETNGRAAITSNGDSARREFELYRNTLRERFETLQWSRNPITIFATRPTKERVEARNYLRSWAAAGGPRCIVLVGEFG